MNPSKNFSILQSTLKWANDHFVKTHSFNQLDSTNIYSKELLFEKDFSTQLVLAGFQTNGKGRGNHHWESSANHNLLSSWCLQLPSHIKIDPTFSCKVGLALYTALKATWPWISFNLKAPNDIYIKDKKLAGLLIEFVQNKNIKVIVGLGLNVFESPITQTSICLSQVLNDSELNDYSWTSFLSNWYSQWNQLFSQNLKITSSLNHLNTFLNEPSNDSSKLNSERESAIQVPLNEFQCVSLLNALNAHPLLSEKYISIHKDGSLQNSKGLIHWSNL